MWEFVGNPSRAEPPGLNVSSQIPSKEQSRTWISVEMGELAVSAVLSIRRGFLPEGLGRGSPRTGWSGEGVAGGTLARGKLLFILTLFGFWK